MNAPQCLDHFEQALTKVEAGQARPDSLGNHRKNVSQWWDKNQSHVRSQDPALVQRIEQALQRYQKLRNPGQGPLGTAPPAGPPANASTTPKVDMTTQPVSPRSQVGQNSRGMPFSELPPSNRTNPQKGLLNNPFVNPYTFMPFTSQPPEQRPPTARNRDDQAEVDAFTGTITVSLRNHTPLLTIDPKPTSGEAEHKRYQILKIGKDVIVPATGVRGAMRSMLEAICGGSVAVLADHIWLREGHYPNGRIGQTAILAQVHEPGDTTRSGTLLLGETREVVTAETVDQGDKRMWKFREPCLESAHGARDGKDHDSSGYHQNQMRVWTDDTNTSFIQSSKRNPIEAPDAHHCWRVKVTGRPVGPPKKKPDGTPLDKAHKRDGCFRPLVPAKTLELPAERWAEFIGLNYGGALDQRAKHSGGHLHRGDLVWLILNQDISAIGGITNLRPENVLCISWTRWPRRGSPLWKRMPAHAFPAGWSQDGQVDAVADLFGAVPLKPPFPADKDTICAFAARVRPDNLVFLAAQCDCGVRLAPLMPPHPSHRAFYRHSNDPAKVCVDKIFFDQATNDEKKSQFPACPLRGYKTYRVPKAGDQPWPYGQQPIPGAENQPCQRVNKTVDLLRPGQTGTVSFALRSLSPVECGLLLEVLADGFPWRLGGGKPLGLGCCQIVGPPQVRDECGLPVAQAILEAWRAALRKDPLWSRIEKRLNLWRQSQKPVAEKLRYPRASESGKSGGHVWFALLAKEKMNQPWGIQDYKGVAGQLLPHLQDADPHLYGFEANLEKGGKPRGQDRGQGRRPPNRW